MSSLMSGEGTSQVPTVLRWRAGVRLNVYSAVEILYLSFFADVLESAILVLLNIHSEHTQLRPLSYNTDIALSVITIPLN
jgi:hypothetical protein